MRATIERSAPEAFMSPLHTRDEDESYRVIRGRLTAAIAGANGIELLGPPGAVPA
jgi:hypothetical protein